MLPFVVTIIISDACHPRPVTHRTLFRLAGGVSNKKVVYGV